MVITAAPGEAGFELGVPYCTANPNSSGEVARTVAYGSPDPLDDDVRLLTVGMPRNFVGFYLTSRVQDQVPLAGGSQGTLCLGSGIGRFSNSSLGQIKFSGEAGRVELDTEQGEWTTQAIPSGTGPYAADVGVTTNFQLWFRDRNPDRTSNTSLPTSILWR